MSNITADNYRRLYKAQLQCQALAGDCEALRITLGEIMCDTEGISDTDCLAIRALWYLASGIEAHFSERRHYFQDWDVESACSDESAKAVRREALHARGATTHAVYKENYDD